MRLFARGAADFIYPPACRLCAAELSPRGTSPRAVPFCNGCRQELLLTRSPACVQCGSSIGPYLDPHLPCAVCRDERFAFERVVRLGVYEGALRTACLRCKHRDAEPLAAAMADLVWECESESLLKAGIDVVVPIPRHWLRRIRHPHHPATTLGAVWAARLKVPLAPHILRKCRWTRPQVSLNPSERRVNLRNAFQAASSAGLSGATVLLADDVMTTGTTAHETAKVLRQAGAARVVAVVVSRGMGRR